MFVKIDKFENTVVCYGEAHFFREKMGTLQSAVHCFHCTGLQALDWCLLTATKG